MKKKSASLRLPTSLIVAGNSLDPETDAVIPPVHFSTTYVQDVSGQNKGYDYARTKQPTRVRLEEAYRALENARYALSLSSGMAAAGILLQSLATGAHVVASRVLYGGTYRLLTKVFASSRKVSFLDLTDLNAVEAMCKLGKVDVLWIESPTNPLIEIVDIVALVRIAKKYKVRTIIDNTLATPIAQRPLDMGVDVVFHSATKYLNGHSDVIAGAIMLNDKAWYESLFFLQNALGTTPSGMDSWLMMRGLKTLAVRMECHEKNALALAHYLENHQEVKRVFYPGLTSHPQHPLAKTQMKNFGGMVTIRLGSEKRVKSFLKKLSLFHFAVSLGGVESLVNYPATMTHASMPAALRHELGITPDVVRLSVGIEHVEDLKEDLEHALK